ncbi:putative toxin biosynthesis protein [Botrytis fragariae]|uniref:Putative toxin biosynthesis protein n=1 Tax=Botrytis fragariae TaxID=1964551 RepID=A0A8H6AN63_9HELO|nr:putative toxin biosynthesis protein [Botrytis fragariae]KAF5870716.1 putative toxin biosynthesis protein [Botrytis fragariae]
MSSSYFNVFEHTIPCQHLREYPRSIKTRQEDVLQLAIKQYEPIHKNGLQDDAVTIIATHANGFIKEAYEPLWDDLLQLSENLGFQIRNIWIADISNQGASGVMNESLQGDDNSYFDHSRDLLQMINTFREQMIRPIIGIGHSFGATQLVGLSIMHPRLFTSLILLEPIIQSSPPPGGNVARSSSYRPDLWPSLSAASHAFRQNKFFAGLDPRVLDKILKYGIRKIPTLLYPISETAKEGAYTLTTTKHQEVWSFLRPNFEGRDSHASQNRFDHLLFPDISMEQRGLPFYRPEVSIAQEYLAYLRPSVLYIFGAKSYFSAPDLQNEKMERTGSGLGGSGGVKMGQVEKHIFENLSHMAPLEDVRGCTNVIGEWMDKKLTQFKADEEAMRKIDPQKSTNDMLIMSQKWLDLVKSPIPLKLSKANL